MSFDYDVEREKRKQEEIRKAFRECFPLAAEGDLPWAACHIKDFLRERIRREVEEGIFHFRAAVVKVLCEESPPKTHVEDMARIVVTALHKARRERDQWEREAERLQAELDKTKGETPHGIP